MADWVWDLYDWNTRGYLGSLQGATDRNVSPSHNAPGAASFGISLYDDICPYIKLHRTYVQATRNGVVRFKGKVTDIDDDAETAHRNVNCLGMWEIVDHRFVYEDLLFENFTCGRIAWSLLAHSFLNDGDLGWVIGPSQDAGFVIPNITVPKDANIGEFIDKLTKVENGIDIKYDEVLDRFQFLSAMGTTKPDAQFGYIEGPANLKTIGRKQDGSRKVNKMKAISARNGNYVLDGNDTNILETGVYMEIESLTGVNAENENDVLSAYIAGETLIRADGVTTYTCVPLSPKNPGWSQDVVTPMPWDDFNLADTVYLSCDVGDLKLDQQGVRVWGWNVNIDDNDVETLTEISISK